MYELSISTKIGDIEWHNGPYFTKFGGFRAHCVKVVEDVAHTPTHTSILWPFFHDHPGEPVPEENLWNLWCKGRLTEADTPTIRLGATPSGLSSAHLHHPPFFYRPDAFLLPNQQCQSTEGNWLKMSQYHNKSSHSLSHLLISGIYCRLVT